MTLHRLSGGLLALAVLACACGDDGGDANDDTSTSTENQGVLTELCQGVAV